VLNGIIDFVYDIRKGTLMVGTHDLVNKIHAKAIIINARNEFNLAVLPMQMAILV